MKSATSRKENVVNGANMQELLKAVDAVKKTAAIAKLLFSADNT